MLVVFLVVGLVCWNAHQRRTERRAIIEIQSLGGEVELYRRSQSPDLDWLRNVLGEEPVESVFNHQVSVALGDTRIMDSDLVHLKNISHLDWLNLYNTPITDEGLVHLRCLTKLRGLYLNDTNITDAGLPHLESLDNLDTLSLENTRVTFEGLRKLQRALPNCDIDYVTSQ